MPQQIAAVGVDLCGVNRFKKYLAQKKFLQKIFSEQELNLAFDSHNPSLYLSKCWAARESLIKALNLSVFSFDLTLLVVDPTLQRWQLDQSILDYIELQLITKIFLSINESHQMAIAVTILRKSSA